MSNNFSMAKYPMATRALQEQDGLFKFLGGAGTPDEIKELQKTVATIIDSEAIGGPKQKDAMLAMAILMSAPHYIFDEPSRFEKDYNKSVQKLVNESMSREIETKPSAGISQIIMAMFVASTQTDMAQNVGKMSFTEVYGAQRELDELAVGFEVYKKQGKNLTLAASVDDSFNKANQQLEQRLQHLERNPLDTFAGRAFDLIEDLSKAFERALGDDLGDIFGDKPKSQQQQKPKR